MTEYIFREVHYGYTDGTVLGRKFEKQEEIVRCRDCKWMSKDTVHYKACYRLHAIEFMVEPDGFCAWGERANFATCECGEDIELGNRESAVCPRCNRTVRA